MRFCLISKEMKREVKILLFFLLLVPLGLLGGGAWGEWAGEELKRILGFVPEGFQKISGLWNAPFPDYTFPGMGEFPSYVLSALVGVLLIFGLFYLLEKLKK